MWSTPRPLLPASVLALTLAFALPALADPPSHAPAHGWRKKHDPAYVGYTGRNWDQDYGVVAGRCNRDAVGAVIGGMVGGAIGSRVGDGSGRTVAIIAGTIIGAKIGYEIGQDMDNVDRGCFGHALELGANGTTIRWDNPALKLTYSLTPTGPSANNAAACRDFKLVTTQDGRRRDGYGRACRTADGEWTLVNRQLLGRATDRG